MEKVYAIAGKKASKSPFSRHCGHSHRIKINDAVRPVHTLPPWAAAKREDRRLHCSASPSRLFPLMPPAYLASNGHKANASPAPAGHGAAPAGSRSGYVVHGPWGRTYPPVGHTGRPPGLQPGPPKPLSAPGPLRCPPSLWQPVG